MDLETEKISMKFKYFITSETKILVWSLFIHRLTRTRPLKNPVLIEQHNFSRKTEYKVKIRKSACAYIALH